MGLSSCSRIVKYLLLLINFLFWIVGFTALGLFIWVLSDPSLVISMAQERNHFYIGLYVFLVVGLLMLVVAILGCCGSLKESRCMLIGFFCCLLVVIVAQVSAGAWAYHNRDKLDLMIRSSVKNTVQNEYSVIDSQTNAFDTFQQHFQCCGANGPNDWLSSKFNAATSPPPAGDSGSADTAAAAALDAPATKTISLEVSSPSASYTIPRSCCLHTVADEAACDRARVLPIASPIDGQQLHLQGCTEKLVSAFQENVHCLFAIALCVVSVELLGLIFALVLSCSIKSSDYK